MSPQHSFVATLSLALLAALPPSPLAAGGAKKESGTAKTKAFTPLDVNGTLDKAATPDKLRNDTPCQVHLVYFHKGRTYQIDMTSTALDAYLRLETDVGEPLAEDDDSGGQLDARIHFLAPADGTYRIIATAFNQDAAGAYRLTVIEEKVPKSQLDITAQLNNTDPADRLRGGYFKAHRLTCSKDKIYQIDLTSNDFDAYLRLEDTAGKLIAQDDDSGGNLNARIVFKAAQDGIYRITATTFGPGSSGKYRLKVTERDPTKDVVGDLKVGEPKRDTLAFGDPHSERQPTKGRPMKMYRVTLEAGQTYVIELQSEAFDSYLYLLDGKKQPVAADDDSGGNLNARITYRPDTGGVFYVVATALDERFGGFVLTVRKE